MINLQVAKLFYQIAEYYAMDEVAFKPQAYERAARILESTEDDLADIYKDGGIKALMKIPGVGQGLAEKIEEYIKAGKIKEYEKLKKACPVDLEHLTAVQGLGPKSIKTLYQKLKIKTLADLEKVAKAGEIAKLPRFGPKVQENILRGIQYVKGGQGRMLLGYALPLARKFEARLNELPGVERAIAAGSIRRMKETVGDIDILAIAKHPAKVMDYFCSMTEVEKVLSKGETRSSVKLHSGLDADLRVLSHESFGAGLQYFTGSKDHNVALRELAQKKGYKLNEYGLFHNNPSASLRVKNKKDKEVWVAGKTEEEIYEKLGLQYIEPEMRENTGELELALRQVSTPSSTRGAQGKPDGLPKIVGYSEVLGDFQMHSEWSDGANTILEMAEAAKKLGRKYMPLPTTPGGWRLPAG